MSAAKYAIGFIVILVIMRLFVATFLSTSMDASIRECADTGDALTGCKETIADIQHLTLGTFPGLPPLVNAFIIAIQAVILTILILYWIRGA
jgi:hypothetical protein